MEDRSPSRRRYLLQVGAAGATALAGCAGGGGNDDEDPDASRAGSGSSPDEPDGGSDETPSTNGTEDDDSSDGNRTEDDRTTGANGTVRTFRYDEANSGHDPTGSGPASEPDVEWAADIGEMVRSSPAVVDGTVYVGSWDGAVYALDAGSGDELWRTETRDSISSSPAVVDGTVYAGSHDGTVYALESAGGDEDWRFETDGPVLSSPTVVDGTVFVGSHDGRIYAIDAASGTESWQYDHDRDGPDTAVRTDETSTGGTGTGGFPTDSAMSSRHSSALGFADRRQQEPAGTSTPAAVDDTVYVVRGSSLLALDGTAGGLAWEYPLESSAASLGRRPVDGQTTTSLRSRGHALARPLQVGYTIPSSPAVVDGTVYVGRNPDLHAVDASGPDGRWTQQATTRAGDSVRLLGYAGGPSGHSRSGGQVHYGVTSSPAVANGLVYAGGEGVTAYAAESGDLEWEQPLEAAVESSPAVVGGAVYVGATDGGLYAFDAAEGTERWAVDLGDAVRSSPAVVDGAVYVGTDGGTVYALTDS